MTPEAISRLIDRLQETPLPSLNRMARDRKDAAEALQQLSERSAKPSQPICCYCDNDLSCAHCGREQPDDETFRTRSSERTDERYERLRRTLEQHAVRLMGPRSPFWQCSYCQALSQTPIAFKHKPECLMAVPEPKPYSKTNECPSCHEQYTDGQTCRAVGGRGGCPMGGDF